MAALSLTGRIVYKMLFMKLLNNTRSKEHARNRSFSFDARGINLLHFQYLSKRVGNRTCTKGLVSYIYV